MAEGTVLVDEGGGLHLAARNTLVDRRCATADARCAAAGEPHHGVAQAPALRAFLDDLRVDAVARVTDSAFGAASRDAGHGVVHAGIDAWLTEDAPRVTIVGSYTDPAAFLTDHPAATPAVDVVVAALTFDENGPDLVALEQLRRAGNTSSSSAIWSAPR
jgi:hypothetical protein